MKFPARLYPTDVLLAGVQRTAANHEIGRHCVTNPVTVAAASVVSSALDQAMATTGDAVRPGKCVCSWL